MYLDLRDLGYLDLRDFGGCFVRIAALSYGSQAGSFEIHTGGGGDDTLSQDRWVLN